ncbi:Zinc finger protein [Plakobranchus ocellatus]|uniref:Zinc finger protein n=1 Tax=Plakobranchus ocellatus TaxID=259542 RepID=A0AAV4A9R1_9GAST|nr:Zinc finger protein [Plakobranchus ocellatus]
MKNQQERTDMEEPVSQDDTSSRAPATGAQQQEQQYAETAYLLKIEAVAEALVDIYSRFGVPKEVLSNQGTQFMCAAS